MGAVATQPRHHAPSFRTDAVDSTAAARSERTLDDVIAAAWRQGSDGRTACPVCGSEMRLADRDVIRCDGCGSELY